MTLRSQILKVVVELQNSPWPQMRPTKKKTGKKPPKQDITKYITEIKADEVLMLGSKKELSEAEVLNLEVQQ